MTLIGTATNLLVFINALRPELTRLFDRHRGDIAAARRDLQGLLPEIEREEAKIDRALEAQQVPTARPPETVELPKRRKATPES